MCLSRSASEQMLLARETERKAAVQNPATTPHVAATPSQHSIGSSITQRSGDSKRRERESLADLLFDDAEEEDSNSYMQWREFGLLYLTYMGFLLSRKNYGFWLRSVISDLGYEKSQAGLLGSTLEITYGACSFLNGVVIDTRSPRQLLIGALLLSALMNFAVAQSSSSLSAMILLWGLNGAVQSVGWPSVTNVFLAWFPDPAQRGAWYSLLSTCQNAGAALVPLLVTLSVGSHGWRAALYVPALGSALVAAVLAVFLYGSPAAYEAARSGVKVEVSRKAKPSPADLAHTMRHQVFLNPSLWLMAATYFAISMVRTCLQDWTSLFLSEQKGLSIATSARCLFLWELGGFAGTFAAGAASDRLFSGRRGPVVCVCCALLAPSLCLLLRASSPLAVQLIYLWLGTCAFPVHVLLGLFSREVVPPSVSSSAGGFVKMIAQVGGASAGYPLGLLQQHLGWGGVFGFLAAVALCAAAAALPLWTTTAAIRIKGRNGTVQDFKEIQMRRKGSSEKDLVRKGLLAQGREAQCRAEGGLRHKDKYS